MPKRKPQRIIWNHTVWKPAVVGHPRDTGYVGFDIRSGVLMQPGRILEPIERIATVNFGENDHIDNAVGAMTNQQDIYQRMDRIFSYLRLLDDTSRDIAVQVGADYFEVDAVYGIRGIKPHGELFLEADYNQTTRWHEHPPQAAEHVTRVIRPFVHLYAGHDTLERKARRLSGRKRPKIDPTSARGIESFARISMGELGYVDISALRGVFEEECARAGLTLEEVI
jgi:hypothetical protein